MRTRILAVAFAAIALFSCSSRKAAAPVAAAPVAAPSAQPAENPPDVRARMPNRPMAPQPETKFPPPQRVSEKDPPEPGAPSPAELLAGSTPILLDGQPFPKRQVYDPRIPEPKRLVYVDPDLPVDGDGSAGHPWNDLQAALCRLVPGDRLVLAATIYEGSFVIGDKCSAGTADAPIQVFARHAFLKPDGRGDLLTVERPHWKFWEVQLSLLESPNQGFVIRGPNAHHIAIDQSHIFEGEGTAVRIGAGASDVTISNCHIHHTHGIRVERGTDRITFINDHIHHNAETSVTVGAEGSDAPATHLVMTGNRFGNDRGAAVDLGRVTGAVLRDNYLANYRPNEETGRGGAALIVRGGSKDVLFEGNAVLEATTAAHIAASADPAPRDVTIRRNFFENKLTDDAVWLRAEAGTNVSVHNNVVNRYATAIRISGPATGLVVANNLVVNPTLAWDLAGTPGFSLFDYNLFASSVPLEARVDAKSVSAADWIRGHMPHSRIVSGADLTDADLAHVTQFGGIDAGVLIEGDTPKQGKPDIGIADQ